MLPVKSQDWRLLQMPQFKKILLMPTSLVFLLHLYTILNVLTRLEFMLMHLLRTNFPLVMWLNHWLLSQVRWAKTWSLNPLRSLWLSGWTSSQDILQGLSLQSTGLSPESHLEALTAPPRQPFSRWKPSLYTWKTSLRLMVMVSLCYAWTTRECRISSSTLLTERSSSLTSISSERTIPICWIRAKISMHH
jgi:hypothetical protein